MKMLPSNDISPQMSLQAMRTPEFSVSQKNVTPAPDSHRRNSSLENLLAHLDSSKQALEHEVQQLLEENILSKSAKKDNHWQVERARILSDLNAANTSKIKKEEQIHELEKELGVFKVTLEHVQRQCEKAEQAVDKSAIERANLHAEIEHHHSAIQDLEKNCKSKQDMLEQQQQRLTELEYQFEELENKYSRAAQELSEKTEQLILMRDEYEKVCAALAQMQIQQMLEMQQVHNTMEICQLKCEQQEVILQDREIELATFGTQVKKLEARCLAAEADANVKAALLSQMQSELDTLATGTISLEAQVDDCKAQAGVLKTTLTIVEKALAHERSSKAKVESTLAEYKHRERHLLQVDKAHRNLQQEAKWRNEQFQSLEEAHSKLRKQFHEARCQWDSEKTDMFKEIDLLQDNLQSKERVAQDNRTQLQTLHQALAHEESRRKLLALQSTQAQAGKENVAIEFEAAQSGIETLRASTTKEIASLRETLSAKNMQIKEMQLKHVQIEQECDNLRRIEVQFQTYKRDHEELQQALQDEQIWVHKKANGFSFERTKGKKNHLSQEEMDKLLKSLAAAEASIASKDAQLIEIEIELDRRKASIEDLEHKHSKLEQELERVLLLLDDTEKHRAKSESQTTNLELQLSQASLFVNQQLEDMIGERDMLVRDVHAKELDILELKKDNEKLTIVRDLLEDAGKDMHERELQLIREVKSNSTTVQKLGISLEVTEESLASAYAQLNDLNSKLRHAEKLCAQLQINKEAVQKLKEKLSKAEANVQEMEEKLIASEWTVQQLASEISKVKLCLSQKEREAALLQNQFSDLISQQRRKESEMLEMKCNLEKVLNTNLTKEAEVCTLTRRVQDMENERAEWKTLEAEQTIELNVIRTALAETQTALAATESAVERGIELHRVTEGALEILKLQLTDEKKRNAACQCEMENLRENLNRTKEEASIQLAELKEKKQQLEQSQDHCHKASYAMTDLQSQLMSMQTRLENSERKMEKGAADLVQYKENCSDLLDLIEKQHQALKDMEAELELVQLEAMNPLQKEFDVAMGTFAAEDVSEVKKLKLESRITDLEAEVGEQKVQAALNANARKLEREQLQDSNKSLQAMVRTLQAELKGWKEKAESLADKNSDVVVLQSELVVWRQRAHEGRALILELQQSMHEVEPVMLEWKENIASITDEGRKMREEMHFSLKDLNRELEATKVEVAAWEERSALVAEEAIFFNADLESSIKEFKAEVEVWKGRALSAMAEGKAKQEQLEHSIEDLRSELETWKGNADTASSEGQTMMQRVSELECSLQALQKCVEAGKVEVMEWKERAEAAVQETTVMKGELDECIRNLQAELEGWKNRGAMAAGQCLVLRKKNEDAAKQLKVLQAELLDGKNLVAEAEEETRFVKSEHSTLQSWVKVLQSEDKALRTEIVQWKEKATSEKLELESCIRSLQVELEGWKQRAQEEEGMKNHLEDMIQSLQVEVDGWKLKAVSAEDEGESVKLDLLDTLEKLEGQLEEWSEEEIFTHREGRRKKGDLAVPLKALQWGGKDIASPTVENCTMEECDSLTRDLEGELEDWKERAVFAEEKEKCLRKQFNSTVENLQMEVEARQKIAACIAEDRRIVQLELEKQLKDLQVESLQVKDTAITQGGDMAKEFEAAMVEMQAELDASKRQVADSAMNGELLRTAFDDAMKAVQKESAVWEENLVSANEQLRSVKTQLTDCMQALQSEVVMCRERIESIIQEGSSEKQELHDRINELQMDLREWKERAESLEHQLKDSHTKSQTESQEWRERSVAIAQETVSLQTELQSTKDIVIKLRTQLDTYKENKFSQEKLNEELQRNLLLVSEEAEVRKEKLLQVLSDLENTQTHQNELQRKLHLAHQHMLEDERRTYNMSTVEKEVAVMAVNHGSERVEFPWLLSSDSSKHEHVSKGDAEGNQAITVTGDDEMTCKARKFGSIREQRQYLELCTSFMRQNKDHLPKQWKGMEVCGRLQVEKAFFQVLEENPTQNWCQKRSAKSGVLEEVDGNLPLVSSIERFPSADEHLCSPFLISSQSQTPRRSRCTFDTTS
ncbi:unnamed protein product [Sphagnum jensenii]